MGLMTRYTEIDYHSRNTGRAAEWDYRFCGEEEKQITFILCDCEALPNTEKTKSWERMHLEALMQSRRHPRTTPIMEETERLALDESKGMQRE